MGEYQWYAPESKKVLWDNYSVIKTAYDKGWEEGWTARIEEIASKMKSRGIPAEEIAECIGLTVKEIEKL